MADDVIKIRIEGTEHLLARLNSIRAAGWGIRESTERAVLYVHSQVPPYPPQRPNSSYQRTGTLGRSYTTEVRAIGASAYEGILGTNVSYARDVVSLGEQAKVHEGRWYTLQGVRDKARAAVLQIYETTIRSLLGG